DSPQRETVLPPGGSDQDAVVRGKHRLLRDGPVDLALKVEEKAGPAKGGMMGAQVDLGALMTASALHRPPEITERISMSSSSCIRSSSVSRRLSRITITVAGSNASFSRRAATRRRPEKVTVLFCGSSMTRTAKHPTTHCPERQEPLTTAYVMPYPSKIRYALPAFSVLICR